MLEVDDTLGVRAPQVDLLGPQGREYEEFAARAGDGDVQSPMSAGAVQRGNLRRHTPGLVRSDRDRENDHVALVTLHVFDVLDEGGLGRLAAVEEPVQ